MTRKNTKKQRLGFSLVELLVVISIVAVLSALLLFAIKLVRIQANKIVCLSSLRSIGQAISAYTNDWEGVLPGPTSYGQPHDYTINDRYLSLYLWEYLDGKAPNATTQVLKSFTCNEALRRKSQLSYMGFNGDPTFGAPGTQKRWSPFGVYAGASSIWNRDPWRLAEARQITMLWALKDVDQMNVNSLTGWWPRIPAKPVHGAVRNALFFDFHSESVLASSDTGVY